MHSPVRRRFIRGDPVACPVLIMVSGSLLVFYSMQLVQLRFLVPGTLSIGHLWLWLWLNG